ncbi:MAG: hypothetical protein MUO24_09060 [Desulfobacterales bacterium]|nr:hypothetical protein [Desulfobacterales bacterium]
MPTDQNFSISIVLCIVFCYIIIMKIILVVVLAIIITLPLYGQIPTPTKTSNKPQNQAINRQKQTKPKNNLAQKSVPSPAPLSLPPVTEKIPPDMSNKQNNSKAPTWLMILFSGVLALVAVLQFILAFMQGQWIRSSQRAFIFIESIDVGNITGNPPTPVNKKTITPVGAWIFRPKLGPTTFMIITNSGRTPAYNVIHWGNICIREFPLTSDLPVEITGEIKSVSALPPNGKNTKTLMMQKPLTTKEVQNLVSGKTAIYVYGNITYKDAFGKEHFTHYRVMQNGLTGIMGQSTTLTSCEEGNEAS